MTRNAFLRFGILVILLSLLVNFAEQPRAATFVVINANDTGPGSLRNAINTANANVGNDLITFNIPGAGPFTIVPATQLPALTDPDGVVIDGLTQPGASAGLTPPSTAHLMIELSGFAAGLVASGLVIHSSNNVIQGLVINRFSDNGIFINGGNPLRADSNFVYCNFIGTDTTGLLDLGNGTSLAALYAGVYITAGGLGDPIAMENVVDACLISGNYAEGVAIVGAQEPGDVYQNRVNNCYIGTDKTGISGLGNDHQGVCICEGTHDNIVEYSIICDNQYDGVGIQGYPPDLIYTHHNRIFENKIGVNAIGQTLGNVMHGIAVGIYGPNNWGFARYNTIGRNNVIAYNGGDGVSVWEDPSTNNNGDYNQIYENSTYDNGGLGIDLNDDGVTPNDFSDLDDRANRELNFPGITSATLLTVSGTLSIDGPEDQARVEVFIADSDPTGFGEGQTFLGSAVPDAAGNWSLSVAGLVSGGDTVTATTTDSLDETSEFCRNYPVSAPIITPVPGVIWHVLEWFRPPDEPPLGTEWVELWPSYSRSATLSDWSDNGDDILSYCDTIFFENPQTGLRSWYHVELVTPTIKMVQTGNDEDTVYMEGLDENPLIDPIYEPLGTYWHGVHPQVYYCTTWELTDWEDNGNGYLDSCDMVYMETVDGQTKATFHIEGFNTDIVTTPLPTPADEYDHNLDEYDPTQGDPTGTLWHELYPNYCMDWDLQQWWDNGDGYLSYCDTVLFSYTDADSFILKHIEEVTLTLELTIEGQGITYMDMMGGYPLEDITDPTGIFWHQVWPNFSKRYLCTGWTDNGSTILDYCDYILLESIDGADSGQVYEYHVEAVQTDIISTYLPYGEADTCEYYKGPYEDYVPNGMPDFDQKQDMWSLSFDPQKWTHCGPVALANCFWWFDSKFEPFPLDPRPFYPSALSPGLNDNYPLVQSYEPTGAGWDDHDTMNVIPFVDSLALYCHTNGAGTGTNIHDLVAGAENWLTSRGLLDDYTIALIPGDLLNYNLIMEEVLASQDVILLLGFWEDIGSDICRRIGGHYATVAGVCTTSTSICISDPYYDHIEGEPPAGSAHSAGVHNDAYYVSGPHGTIHHDRYDVVAPPPPCNAPPFMSLPDYPITPSDGYVFENQNEGDIPSVDYLGGPLVTLIEYAVIICPTDTCANQMPGDANTDGDIDDADIVYLLNFLYLGGSAPNPLANGDPNGDCRIDKGDVFYLEAHLFLGGPPPVYCTCLAPDTVNACCYGTVGNTNCSHDEQPDISDITRLIDYLYISHDPLCCPPEADANGSGDPEPDISDITKLIDHLYISHAPLPLCP